VNDMNIFNLVAYSSLKCSVIILCIILLKYIVKDRFGVKWNYYIWFILIIGLMMPYAPNSPLSLFTLVKGIGLKFATKSSYIISNESTVGLVNLIQNDGFPMEEILQSNGGYSLDILTVIWLIGTAIVLGVTVIVNIQFRKKWKKEAINADSYEYRVLSECKSKMRINKDIPIYYTKSVSGPVLYGLICPCLLLPYELKNRFSMEELTCIMIHELAHMKRKDIAVFWLMAILKAVYWFNPIIWYGLYRMRQDCEVACDALALSNMNGDENIKYGHTIINMLKRASSLKAQEVVSTASMADNKKQIIRRLEMISKFKKNSYKLSITSLCILLILGYALVTNAEEGNQTMTWPLIDYYRITSPFGWRTHPISNEKIFHSGIDIPAPEGSNIVSASDGTVIFAEYHETYGNLVKIQYDNDIVILYAHCSKLLVNEGDNVVAGDLIAEVGSTGKATGSHLHFEIQKDGEPVDPVEGFFEAQLSNND